MPDHSAPDKDVRSRGWEEHRREQLVLGLAVTPAERLAWLEEMIEFAYRAGALPRQARND
jgi:hypothetical protein